MSKFTIFDPPNFEDIRNASISHRNIITLSGIPTEAPGGGSMGEDDYVFFIWPDSVTMKEPNPIAVVASGSHAQNARENIGAATFVCVDGRIEGRTGISVIVASTIVFQTDKEEG